MPCSIWTSRPGRLSSFYTMQKATARAQCCRWPSCAHGASGAAIVVVLVLVRIRES